MLLLSSYQGNEARFENFHTSVIQDKVFLEYKLVKAFENDFEEIFKSGQNIEIMFKITFDLNNTVIFEDVFIHSVVFDPLKQVFYVMIEDKELNITTDSYEELKAIISEVQYSFEDELIYDCEVTIMAYLSKIQMVSAKKDFDLMLLWKYNKPKLTHKIMGEQNEN